MDPLDWADVMTDRASRSKPDGGTVTSAAEQPPPREILLTLDEAAEILRLRRRTVAGYARRGELKGRLIGRRWRFRRQAIDAFYDRAPEWRFAEENSDRK